MDFPDFEDENSIEETFELPVDGADGIVARSYQVELFGNAMEKNSILVLGTGSGKTYIAVMLIKEYGDQIIGKMTEGAKRSVFIVNTVPLVDQQALAIQNSTPFKVGKYEGSMDVDNWTDEKWEEELDNNEVLVMVAQIFSDLLNSCRLQLSNLNLIIMDECHHATGNHPMRESMRNYSSQKLAGFPVPRVLGLTACIIHRKCSVKDVPKLIREVESAMDCALVTATNQKEVKKFATKANITIIGYARNATAGSLYNELGDRLSYIKKQMDILIEESGLVLRDQFKVKGNIKKMLVSTLKIYEDLGLYCFISVVDSVSEYLLDVDCDLPEEIELFASFSKYFDEIREYIKRTIKTVVDPQKDISNKVKRLLEMIKMCRNKERMNMLLFVERRNMAKILTVLLNVLSASDSELSFIKACCIIGGSSIKEDVKVKMEIRKQREAMKKFRLGEINVVVCTSVLEEGVDIRACNMVVRFDPSNNFRSFIQSLGRARAEIAHYIIFTEDSAISGVVKDVRTYLDINKELIKICHNRILPSQEEMTEHFADCEIPPFAPLGVSGPHVTAISSLQLINKYCGKLPQDKFTRLYVSQKTQKDGSGNVKIGLTLPLSAPAKFREITWGDFMSNLDLAKQSVCLKLAEKLFYANELDHNLLPRRYTAETIEWNYFDVPTEAVAKDQPKPGTRKRRQVYKKEICNAFSTCRSAMYLHKLVMNNITYGSNPKLSVNGSSHNVGFVCGSPVDCITFPLNSYKWGSARVTVECTNAAVPPSKYKIIKKFHELVMKTLLKLAEKPFEFDPISSGHNIFVVPLNDFYEVDYSLLESVSTLSTLFTTTESCDSKLLTQNPDLAIFPSYDPSNLFYIEKVSTEESPRSPFPEFKKKFKSYIEYYSSKYNINIVDANQSLLVCKHFPKEMNYVSHKGIKLKPSTTQAPRLVPELCHIFSIPASLWWKMLCIPSILYRINGLALERQIMVDMRLINIRQYTNAIDYHWTEKVILELLRGKSDNLCVNLMSSMKNDTIYYPGMFLQALTPISANDQFHLERLEVLGDSFLKYEVGKYLFCKEADDNEGLLTIRRSTLVSNSTLYGLAKKKRLQNMYQNVQLNLSSFIVPFGFTLKDEYEKSCRLRCLPPSLWTTGAQEGLEESRVPEAEVYNPWTEQLVPDKCVADCVEALLGSMMLMGGEKLALHYMRWIGYKFLAEKVEIPHSALLQYPSWVFKELNRLFLSLRLNEIEDKFQYKFKEKSFLLQAFTHPSSVTNKITHCYQRLEFLGDSVLDYLVTGFIYSRHMDYDPGQMTDLRSYYVKNETLAKVAIKYRLHSHMNFFSSKLSAAIVAFEEMLQDNVKEFNWESDVFNVEDVEVPKALGDLVEAFIGAVFVDSNFDLEVTWHVVKLLMSDVFSDTIDVIPIDCVRELYERCPSVKFEAAAPPEEDQPASCTVKMKGFPPLVGEGKNKRTAKQAAAKLALSRLRLTHSEQPAIVP